jgi:hypothetical protein
VNGLAKAGTDSKRAVAHRRGNPTGRLVVRNCAPDYALTDVNARHTPSLTGKHREASFRSQVVEKAAEKVLWYVSTSLHDIAVQACSFHRAVIARSTTSEVRSSRPTNRVPIATRGPPRRCRTGWPQLFEVRPPARETGSISHARTQSRPAHDCFGHFCLAWKSAINLRDMRSRLGAVQQLIRGCGSNDAMMRGRHPVRCSDD